MSSPVRRVLSVGSKLVLRRSFQNWRMPAVARIVFVDRLNNMYRVRVRQLGDPVLSEATISRQQLSAIFDVVSAGQFSQEFQKMVELKRERRLAKRRRPRGMPARLPEVSPEVVGTRFVAKQAHEKGGIFVPESASAEATAVVEGMAMLRLQGYSLLYSLEELEALWAVEG